MYHSTLGSRVIKKKKEEEQEEQTKYVEDGDDVCFKCLSQVPPRIQSNDSEAGSYSRLIDVVYH